MKMDTTGKNYRRNFHMLGKQFRSLIVLTFSAEICTILSVTADSIVGQRYIDSRSVAAIALLSTFLTVFTMIHDLLASCIVTLVVRRKCEYGDEEASRTLTDIIVITTAVYVTAAVAIALVARPFLNQISDDRELIDLALRYYWPILLTCPLLEIFLCLERGYKTEGNIGFFSIRPVITNVLNIALDMFFVVVLKKQDIRWLAYATVISGLAGYAWSMSYRFRPECNMRLDFSGILKKGRIFRSFKEQVSIGMSFFSGDVVSMVSSGVTNKMMLLYGGTTALVCYGVLNSIRGIVGKLVNAVISNANIFTSALFVEKDNKGLYMIFRATLTAVLIVSLVPILSINVFPGVVANIFSVEKENVTLLRICFACMGSYTVWASVSQFMRTFLISVKREKYSTILTVGERISILGAVLLASYTKSIIGVWLAMGWGSGIFFMAFLIILYKNSRGFDFQDNDVVSCSAVLNEKEVAGMSEKVCDILTARNINDIIATRVGLIVEESCMIIVQRNEGRKVNADVRIYIEDEAIRVYIYYDGKVFSSEKAVREKYESDNTDLGLMVLDWMIESFKYTHISQLNCLEFAVYMPL